MTWWELYALYINTISTVFDDDYGFLKPVLEYIEGQLVSKPVEYLVCTSDSLQ